MNNDAKMIGDALDASMQEFDRCRGISQAELSRRTGVPQPTISRTLKGKSIPEMETLTRLVSVLGAERLGKAVASLLPGASPPKVTALPKKQDPIITRIVKMLESTDDVGRGVALQAITTALENYRPTRKHRAN